MRPCVEATWGAWNEDEQLAKHALNYQPQTHRIITADAEGGVCSQSRSTTITSGWSRSISSRLGEIRASGEA